jgi:nucleoside 2-deoxyribosyltransferase
MSAEVWEPFERNNQIDLTGHDWAYQVGQSNFQDIRKSDAIFAIINGSPLDQGVMIELSIAIALGKQVFLTDPNRSLAK